MTVPRRWLFGLAFFLACTMMARAAGVQAFRMGDNTGEDWEPAIIADGSYVYEFWPHYLATSYKDTSGATCLPFSTRGKAGTTSSYMYFQSSANGGTTWSTVVIPRCPVNGNSVDAQLWLGSGPTGARRLYASYMDGNSQYTPIEVIYSDDHGNHWSAPVDVTNGGRGDKDMLLVDSNNNVSVAFENGGKQHVSLSTNGGASFTVHSISVAPSGVALATGAAMDTHGNRYYGWSGTNNTGKGPTTYYLLASSNLFSSFTISTIDEGQGEPVVSGAGWDYWGGSVQIAVEPETSGNDRIIAVYNAGLAAGGPERIFTKYSDTLGASWNIPFNASSFPNGTQLSLAPSGVWHGFPSVSGSAGLVKVIWQDNRASAGGNYTCTSSATEGKCGTWDIYMRSSADGATNWSAETEFTEATPYLDYTSALGFDHPYGDYTETVNDGTNFYSCWGEGQSYTLNGNVYFAKF